MVTLWKGDSAMSNGVNFSPELPLHKFISVKVPRIQSRIILEKFWILWDLKWVVFNYLRIKNVWRVHFLGRRSRRTASKGNFVGRIRHKRLGQSWIFQFALGRARFRFQKKQELYHVTLANKHIISSEF
mgnify:CR=1 FL=1